MSKAIGFSLLSVTFALFSLALYVTIGSVDYTEFKEYFPRILNGLYLTIFISGLSFVVGLFFSFTFLVLSQIDSTARTMIIWYQSTVRYIPVLLLLYLVYYGAGEISDSLKYLNVWWIFEDPLTCVLLVFVCNTVAYQTNILMGCVDNIEVGQKEAALALGLRPYTILTRILLPQALKTSVGPLGNEYISLIKISSFASVVTVFDLLGQIQSIFSETINISYFFIAAFLYISLITGIQIVIDKISKKVLAI